MQTFELKFSGVTILQGVEFPGFLLILSWALQQCSATALPVMGAAALGPAVFFGPTIGGTGKVLTVQTDDDEITYFTVRCKNYKASFVYLIHSMVQNTITLAVTVR